MGPLERWISAGLVAGLSLACVPSADAGAWPATEGHGQVILKLASERGAYGLDGAGQTLTIPRQAMTSLDLYADYGLTKDLSLQLEAGLERSRLGVREADGLGPCAAGFRYVLARRPEGYLSVYAGGTSPAADERARSDPAVGQAGGELRLLAGQSLRLFGHGLFAEVEVARRLGTDHTGQTRIDSTLGVQLRSRVLLLSQIYAGRQEGMSSGASWLKLDQSVIRTVGEWRVQIGWRQTLAGRNVPATAGPILGLWRRY
jgi:hypothetical protein